jgi:LPS-assembly lipoprotein
MKRVVVHALPLVLALLTGACGFTPRGVQALPFATIAINTPRNTTLGDALARGLQKNTSTRVVTTDASVVLDLQGEFRERQVQVVNAQGRATQYALRDRVRFRLLDTKGRELIEPTELVVQRDISFNDSQRLSKESEENLLYRDMQADLVQQILRRIAATQPYAD